MKANMPFYCTSLFFTFLFLACTIPSFGQPDPTVTTIEPIVGGFVEYTIHDAPDDAHVFTLYGDGTFGNLSSPAHQFKEDGSYLTKVYIVESHEAILPTSMVEVPVEIPSVDYDPAEIPEAAMTGQVDVLTSWAVASGHETFFIIAFRNEASDLPVSGQVVLHYATDEITVTGEILEREDWVDEHVPTDSELPEYDNKLTWDFTALTPGETRYIYVPATVNLAEGEGLQLKAGYIVDDGIHEEIEDKENTFRVRRYPHDPNFKIVNRTCIHPDAPAQHLEYTIGFFNDGETFASDVTLTDELSHWLNPSTMAIVDAEYSHTLDITDHDVEIKFTDIDLPGTNQTSPYTYSYDQASTYITFAICTTMALPSDSCIDNTASIIFDSQPPILTTTARICSGQSCAESRICMASPSFKKTPTFAEPGSPIFSVSPNPMNEKLNIYLANKMAIEGLVEIEILNYTGKRVKQLWQTQEGMTTFQQQFEVGDLAPGLYLLTFKTEDKIYTQKLIKQ